MKLKNNSKNIICVAGEAILPGKTSENDVVETPVIKRMVAKKQVEFVDGKKAKAEELPDDPKTALIKSVKAMRSLDKMKAKAEELPDDPKTALIKSVKAMRSLDKMKEKAEELGVEVAEDDTAETLKEKLVAYYEAQ